MAQFPTSLDSEFNLLQKLVSNTGDLAAGGGGGGSGTVTSVTSANANIGITNTTTTPVLTLASALTLVNSITATAATDLTLNAGVGANNNVVLAPVGTGEARVLLNQNGNTQLDVLNNTVGTASRSGLLLTSDASAGAVTVTQFSSGYTAAGTDDTASSGRLLATGAGGFSFRASNAAGTIRFYTGPTQQVTIGTGGHLLLGGLTSDGTGVLQFPAATTNAGGITFGADTNLYRTAAGVIQILNNTSTAAGLTIGNAAFASGFRLAGGAGSSAQWGTISGAIVDYRIGPGGTSGSDNNIFMVAGAGTTIYTGAGVAAVAWDTQQRSSFTPGVIASGTTAYFKIQTPADTSLTLSTEAPGYVHLTAIRQWATGALALQRENLFNGPTIAFVGASTLTDGFTVGITPVIQGTNATITRIHSLGILDSTSAASSVTGGLIVATTFGTAATSVGIGGGNVNAGGLITGGTMTSTGQFTASSTSTFTGAITQTAKTAKYNNITTAGWGQPAIYASARSTAQVAAVASVATYTVGAADGTFIVAANVNVTAATTATFSTTVTYLDENNTSRTATFSFVQNGVALPIQSITNVTGIGAYAGNPMMIRCKAATVITIATSGTFTSVTYNVEGFIEQVA